MGCNCCVLATIWPQRGAPLKARADRRHRSSRCTPPGSASAERPHIAKPAQATTPTATVTTAATLAEHDPRPRGRIQLSLSRHTTPDGERLRLCITDSGNRLHEPPPEALFTPFVSTKRGGQGIGLMFVREVLQRHGFAYRLAPTGAGETGFEMRMPQESPSAPQAPGRQKGSPW